MLRSSAVLLLLSPCGCALLQAARPLLRVQRAVPARVSDVRASSLTFAAKKRVSSTPFALSKSDPTLRRWFEQPESLKILFSETAESAPVGDGLWESATKIPFPGMVARSVTVIRVEQSEAPSFTLSVVDAMTRTESGPAWVARLLESIQDSSKTRSTNHVSVEINEESGEATVVSDIELSVEFKVPTLPRWIPLPPLGPLERQGSKSLQGVLDKSIAPALERFGEGYTAWAAGVEEPASAAPSP